MKLASHTFLTLSGFFLLATIIVFGWSGCEQMVNPRIYRGEGRPADVILFGKAYAPNQIPLKVRLAHSYGWIPLVLLTLGTFKAAGYFDAKHEASKKASPRE
jgi:hypothetical protein